MKLHLLVVALFSVSSFADVTGGSASGGDLIPPVPAFSYQCQLEYSVSDSTRPAEEIKFELNQLNRKSHHETADYEADFRSQWSDLDRTSILNIMLVLKGTTPGSALRGYTTIEIGQSTIRFAVRKDSASQPTRRLVSIRCQLAS